MGTGKWRDEHAQALRDATVIVVADRDDEGRKHVRQVATSLERVAATVTVVESAAGKDVSDHLDAGCTLAELVPTTRPVESAPTWAIQSWPAYRDTTPNDMRWLIDGLLPEGVLAFVAGPPKKGKTWIGLGLALALATGL